MKTFLITPSIMQSDASQMESLRQKDIETLKQLRILINGLSDSWKGEAQDALVAKFNERQADINEFLETMEDYITLVNTAASKAENLDARLRSMVYRIG